MKRSPRGEKERPAHRSAGGAGEAPIPKPAPVRSPRRRPATKRPAARQASGQFGVVAPRRHASREEQKVQGVRACEALFAHRPGDIVRVYVSARRRPTFKALLEHCAASRLGFQVVDDESLDRVAGGVHHEGIVILAREPARGGAEALLEGVATGAIRGPLLWLDGVQNPHNLGSILRTAAHFGCGAVIGSAGTLPSLSAAAMRVAEGGAEFVPLFEVDDPAAVLGAIGKAGMRRVTTTSRAGAAVAQAGLSRDVVLILGSEGEGVSPSIAALADGRVRIPGSGAVRSLNVAVACGILLAEACRGSGGESPAVPPRGPAAPE